VACLNSRDRCLKVTNHNLIVATAVSKLRITITHQMNEHSCRRQRAANNNRLKQNQSRNACLPEWNLILSILLILLICLLTLRFLLMLVVCFLYRSLNNSRLRKSRDLDDESGGNERGEGKSGADTKHGEHRVNTPSDKPLKLRFIMQ
jgi:ABC-type Fe3+ transport system permease subunit